MILKTAKRVLMDFKIQNFVKENSEVIDDASLDSSCS